jgi:hypothetical protein
MPKGAHEGHGEPPGGGHGEGHDDGHGDNHEAGPGEHEPAEHGLDIPDPMPPLPDLPGHAPGGPGGGEHGPGEGGPRWVPGEFPREPRNPKDGPLGPRHDEEAPSPSLPLLAAGPAELPRNPILDVFRAAQNEALREFSGLDEFDLKMARNDADWRRGADDRARAGDSTVVRSMIDKVLGEKAAESLTGLEWNLGEWHRDKAEVLAKEGIGGLEERANRLLNESRKVYGELAGKGALDEHARTELAKFMISNWEAVNRTLRDAAAGEHGLVGNLWAMERQAYSADSRLIERLRSERSPLDVVDAEIGRLSAGLGSAGKPGTDAINAMTKALGKLRSAFKRLVPGEKKLATHVQEFRDRVAAIDRAANEVRLHDTGGQGDQAKSVQAYLAALEGHVARMLRTNVLPDAGK